MKLSKIQKHVDRANVLTNEGDLNRARLHLQRASRLMFSSPVIKWTILFDADGLQKKHEWLNPNHQERPDRLDYMQNGAYSANVAKVWKAVQMNDTSQSDSMKRKRDEADPSEKENAISVASDSEDDSIVLKPIADEAFKDAARSLKSFQLRNISVKNNPVNYNELMMPDLGKYADDSEDQKEEVESVTAHFYPLMSLYREIHEPEVNGESNATRHGEWMTQFRDDEVSVNAKDTLKAILSEVNMMIKFTEMYAQEQIKAVLLMRPPGHHSHLPTETADPLVQGFCMLSNACFLMDLLLSKHNDLKAVIWDFDFHKGDGTHYFFEQLKTNRRDIFDRCFLCDVYYAYAFPGRNKKDGKKLHAHCKCITKDERKKYAKPFNCEESHIHFHGIGNEFKDENFAVARMSSYRTFHEEMKARCEGDYKNFIHIVSLGFDAHDEDRKAEWIGQQFQSSWPSEQEYEGATNEDFKEFGAMLQHYVDEGSSVVALTEGGYAKESIEEGMKHFMEGVQTPTPKAKRQRTA